MLFKDNLVYNTKNNAVGKTANLLSLADEVASVPRSANNVVINNMFLNGNVDAFSWTLVSGSGLTNAFISNNTLVNGAINTGNLNQNSIILNNIFYRNDGGGMAAVTSLAGLQFEYNIWSKAPAFTAINDTVTDPQLALTGAVSPGALSKTYFALNTNSPALGAGIFINANVANINISSLGNNLNVGAYLNDPLQYTAI